MAKVLLAQKVGEGAIALKVTEVAAFTEGPLVIARLEAETTSRRFSETRGQERLLSLKVH